MSDHNFFFIVHLSYSRFIFTHHLQPIIKEVDSDVEVGVDPDAMAIKVYDPPPSREYVRLGVANLLKTNEALARDLEDCDYVEKEVVKWHLIGYYFYKKVTGREPLRTPTPPISPIFPAPFDLLSDSDSSSDEFCRKLDEKPTKKRGRK